MFKLGDLAVARIPKNNRDYGLDGAVIRLTDYEPEFGIYRGDCVERTGVSAVSWPRIGDNYYFNPKHLREIDR